MVIGLFARATDAAVCLSNLAEEDFRHDQISVVMRTPDEAKAMADVSGRWQAIGVDELLDHLARRGLTPAQLSTYRDGLRRGGVFLAIEAGDATAAARETLEDHQATSVQVIPDE